MQLTCPDCYVECTIDEQSVETVTCPACGILLYSKSGRSGPLAVQLAISAGQKVEATAEALEKTKQWQQSVDESLPEPDRFPQQLGRYELKQILGTGSFADVYLAFDTDLGRDVALKIPRRNRFSSAEQLRRFLDEARTSAILEHPGIVRVYDIGWISDEVCFISMEYCSGGSLNERIKAELPTCERAVELVESLADAIHFAHLHGFVHRDLKPSNVMIGRDGRPRIVDFGLALSDDEQQKHVGEIAGTLPYMSPEQLRGDTHHLDGRTDIWSLGVILYQLLVGRRPYSGSRELIVDQIRNREAKPLRQIKDDVPADLEAICLRCLLKSPAARYPTAKDLAQDLRTFRERQPKSAPHAVPISQHVKPSSQPPPNGKSQIAWIGLAMLVLLGCIGALWAAFGLAGSRGKSGPGIDPGIAQAQNEFSQISIVRRRWYPLLERPPVEFYWPSDAVPYHYNEKQRCLSTDSRYHGLLELGSTDLKHFSIEMQISRSDWSGGRGQCGFYWGLHEVEGGFEAVLFIIDSDHDDVGQYFRARAHQIAMTYTPEKHLMMAGGLAAEAIIQRPQTLDHRINLEIGERGLIDGKWDGQTLQDLPQQFTQNWRSNYQSQGRFGVYNMSGATVFRDVRFMSP